ncbi:MAG TPA: ribosome small subunit-dependent GTPase A [Candidatus Limiplasma sp.]|nr:ribosome small subunit-dependent GTPase A [Candidatus Limiplasma sp.]HPS82583.1 ribosome small subunit-dependent GTPase A [Candidatus Limiplasma sp.]
MTDASFMQGVIVKGVGGLYYARDLEQKIHVLRAKGVFRKRHITPLVGDAIRFSPGAQDDQGWIEEVLPRTNELVRPPVANIRYLVFVLAPEPEPDFLLLDRMLVMARAQRIEPLLVVNKCELDTSLGEKIRREYALAEAPVFEVSAKLGQGVPALANELRKGICCFAGQSGVGKSSLLNAVTGLTLESGEISRKIARGKNTTRHAELLAKDGFQVLDTAGFSLLELSDQLEPVQLKTYYPEFMPFEGDCRFQPCYHKGEPGCAVLEAARNGTLPPERVERYHQLLAKVKETWRNRYV